MSFSVIVFLLYFIFHAALTVSIDIDLVSGSFQQPYTEPPNNTCVAGERHFTSVCGSVKFVGRNSSQYVLYEATPLLQNSTSIRHQHSLTCCLGLGLTKNGTEIYRSIGCGYEEFRRVVYWGNFSGYPGITCRASPTSGLKVAWRYKPVYIIKPPSLSNF